MKSRGVSIAYGDELIGGYAIKRCVFWSVFSMVIELSYLC